MKTQMSKNKTELKTDIELVFDGREVKSVWYHSKLAPVLCALCGKECSTPCHRVNPWCG